MPSAQVARRKTLAMFFDTYEQTGVFLDGWLRSLLHCDYGDVPENMSVTVAGRHQLDPNDWFLKWVPDPEHRSLAVATALPRAVNEDILGVLTSGRSLDETERGQLYGWLRSLPFVARDAGRCTYHAVVRTAMVRLERSQSPTRWRARHHTLAEAHRRWRAAAFAEDASNAPGTDVEGIAGLIEVLGEARSSIEGPRTS